MARGANKLTVREADGRLEPGRHSDGGGLYLVVDELGRKRWIFMYRWRAPGEAGPGRRREMGLGLYAADSKAGLSLRDAREMAREARDQIHKGIDPIDHRRRSVEASAVPTFGRLADAMIEERSKSLRSHKSIERLRRALGPEGHTAALRSLPIDAITTEHVLEAVKPHWHKANGGMLTRGYVERILDAAKTRGWRSGDNPARWRGHLENVLSAPRRLTRGHYAAMAYRDVPDFVSALQRLSSVPARALEFVILTAARPGEALGASWDEIDLERQLWSLPAGRMKAARPHTVPLSPRAVEILLELQVMASAGAVFPGRSAGRLSGTAMLLLMKRMGVAGVTVHGFRSSFRDWVYEETHFPREVAEAALAHTVGDATERAYRRGDALEKRRQLMTAWADYVTGEARAPVRLVAER